MELDRIEALIDLLKDKEVGELEYSEWEGEKGFEIRVSLSGSQVAYSTAPVLQGPSAAATAPASTGSQEAAASESDDAHVLVSPMVGTPYRSPSLRCRCLVQLGDRVQVGQTSAL